MVWYKRNETLGAALLLENNHLCCGHRNCASSHRPVVDCDTCAEVNNDGKESENLDATGGEKENGSVFVKTGSDAVISAKYKTVSALPPSSCAFFPSPPVLCVRLIQGAHSAV